MTKKKDTCPPDPTSPDALIIVERGEGEDRKESLRMGFRFDYSKPVYPQEKDILRLSRMLKAIYANETDHYIHVHVIFTHDYVNI